MSARKENLYFHLKGLKGQEKKIICHCMEKFLKHFQPLGGNYMKKTDSKP